MFEWRTGEKEHAKTGLTHENETFGIGLKKQYAPDDAKHNDEWQYSVEGALDFLFGP